MLPEKKNTAIYRTAWANGFDPYHVGVPGWPGLWTYGVPLVTWEDKARASRAHGKHSTARRVPRRSNGNSLPLIGLRPSMKLKRQHVRLEGLPW
jgi:hypothetical protein